MNNSSIPHEDNNQEHRHDLDHVCHSSVKRHQSHGSCDHTLSLDQLSDEGCGSPFLSSDTAYVFFDGQPWHANSKSKKMAVMTGLILIMFFTELIGGLESGSLALISDAFHMLNDAMSMLLALACSIIATRQRTSHMSYGYERAEIVGALLNGMSLICTSIFIMIEALIRLIEPPIITNPLTLVWIGLVSLIFNLCGVIMFGSHGHSHSNGDDHGHSHGGHDDMNVRAMFLHLVGDALASASVIVTGAAVEWSDWEYKYYLDPIISFLISVIILRASYMLVKKASVIVMQASPSNIEPDALTRKIESIAGIVSAHDLHVWGLNQAHLVCTVHVRIKDVSILTEAMKAVRAILRNSGIQSCTHRLDRRHYFFCVRRHYPA